MGSRKFSWPTAGGVSAGSGLAHGRREQHCSLHVDYLLSSISSITSVVNGFARVLQKAKYQ